MQALQKEFWERMWEKKVPDTCKVHGSVEWYGDECNLYPGRFFPMK